MLVNCAVLPDRRNAFCPQRADQLIHHLTYVAIAVVLVGVFLGLAPTIEPRRAHLIASRRAFSVGIVATVGVRQDHRCSVPVDMPVDALVRDIEPLPIAVEQLPQFVRRPMLLRVSVGGVIGEFCHGGDG